MRKAGIFHLILVLLLVFSSMTPAQEKPEGAVFDGFDEYVAKVLEELRVPGLAIAIVKGDQVILAKGFGFADVENGRPVTSKTLFAIGSASKAFTATCLGMLVEEGKLGWDKPVRDYMTDFRVYDEYATQNMTPRDLCSHRSGLPRHDIMWYGSSYNRSEIYERLQFLEPNKTFREVFQYQNLMFMTAGVLAGKINGTTWEQMVSERIFKPLGMTGSNFSVNDSMKVADHALPYTEEKDKKLKKINFRNIDAVGPAGSINSSVEDMSNWVLLQLNKGKVGEEQIVSEGTMKELHTITTAIPVYPENDDQGVMGYGLGWFIEWYRGHYLLHHGGGIDGFTALVAFMPHQDFGLVILTNKGGTPAPTIVARNVYDRMLGLEMIDWLGKVTEQMKKAEEAQQKEEGEKKSGRVEGTNPSLPLEEYAGDYEHPAYGVVKVKFDGESLSASLNGVRGKLEHFHFDQFVIEDEPFDGTRLKFTIGDTGKVESLFTQVEPALDPIEFTRRAPDEFKTAEYLNQFVGEYELTGMTMKFSIRGEDTLILEAPGQPVWTLEPTAKDEFKIKELTGFTIKFIREEGAITAVESHQPNGVFTARRK